MYRSGSSWSARHVGYQMGVSFYTDAEVEEFLAQCWVSSPDMREIRAQVDLARRRAARRYDPVS